MNAFIMLICGCVVDAESTYGEEHARYTIIECPFCKATFTLNDLTEFSEANKEEIYVYMVSAIRPMPRPLIKYKNQAFEIMEICDCGYPIVRATTLRSRRARHLRVPQGDVMRLFD